MTSRFEAALGITGILFACFVVSILLSLLHEGARAEVVSVLAWVRQNCCTIASVAGLLLVGAIIGVLIHREVE